MESWDKRFKRADKNTKTFGVPSNKGIPNVLILEGFHLFSEYFLPRLCHLQRPAAVPSGDGGTVSDCPQSPDAGFKVSVDHHLIGIELDLNTVEQSFVAGNAGSHLVQGQKHFLDIRHDAVGEYQGTGHPAPASPSGWESGCCGRGAPPWSGALWKSPKV